MPWVNLLTTEVENQVRAIERESAIMSKRKGIATCRAAAPHHRCVVTLTITVLGEVLVIRAVAFCQPARRW
jgi:hypothetical protein